MDLPEGATIPAVGVRNAVAVGQASVEAARTPRVSAMATAQGSLVSAEGGTPALVPIEIVPVNLDVLTGTVTGIGHAVTLVSAMTRHDTMIPRSTLTSHPKNWSAQPGGS